MDIKNKIIIAHQFLAKILSNIIVALIKFILFLKSLFIKLKRKTPQIKATREQIKSICIKLRDAFLYASYMLKIVNQHYIRKRVVYPSIIITILLVISISTIYLDNIIKGSKDYKSVLVVQSSNKIVKRQGLVRNTSNNKNKKVTEYQKDPFVKEIKNDTGQIIKQKRNVITILFLGIDTTEERDKTIAVSRSDTIAIATINFDTKKIKVLNIPRDTYAFIPVENKKDKINHAYAFGLLKGDGIQASIDAVEQFVKYSNIDYYFSTDMQPITEIVDKIGGVKINVDFEIKDILYKGIQLLDGQKALSYIRYRDTPKGDIDRIIHQRMFVDAILSKIKASNQLMDSVSIILNYHKFIKTNMNLKQIASLARFWSDISLETNDYYIVPGQNQFIKKVWYYIPDVVGTEEMLKMMFQ